MYYGDEKARQMARSILPSCMRKEARRRKKLIHSRERLHARLALRNLDEDYETDEDLGWHDRSHRGWLIEERREADKLNHFEKWAEEVTKDLPHEDRLSYIKKVLPDGLIGDHALFHVKWKDHFDPDRVSNRYGRRYTYKAPVDRKPLKDMLYEIVTTPDGHRALNQYMIQEHKVVEWITGYRRNTLFAITEEVGPTTPRLLEGTGDIEDFYNDLLKARSARPVRSDRWLERYPVNRWEWIKKGDPDEHGRISDGLRYRQVRIGFREAERDTRTNPGYHPEWMESVRKFEQVWRLYHGDVIAVRNALKVYG
jgi:hypothetical protein